MATTCPVGFDTEGLQARIGATYNRLAGEPDSDLHFHRGPDYACGRLRYDRALLETLPATATERFAGVGNPHRIGPIHPGEVVLDIGCGAGMDLLLAARRVGPSGHAYGVDPTDGMRARARQAASEDVLSSVVEILAGEAEALPLPDASVDVVQSNGVLNLVPDKARAFREIRRVLRPGGRLHLADVVLRKELALRERSDADLWAGCVAGAALEGEVLELVRAAGLSGGVVTERFDCFGGTAVARRVSPAVGAGAVNVFARA
jgi:SAM-dependent methyltransferase